MGMLSRERTRVEPGAACGEADDPPEISGAPGALVEL